MKQAKIVTLLYARLLEAWCNGELASIDQLLSEFSGVDKATAFTILTECVELGTVTKEAQKFYALAESDAKAFATAHYNLRNNAWQQKNRTAVEPTAKAPDSHVAPLTPKTGTTDATPVTLYPKGEPYQTTYGTVFDALDKLPDPEARHNALKKLCGFTGDWQLTELGEFQMPGYLKERRSTAQALMDAYLARGDAELAELFK